MPKTTPDLHLLDDVVARGVLDAMRGASKILASLGIRHALVGGLGVGAHGHPRATRDVDFLVGDEAFEHHPGGFVTMKYGVPIQFEGVAVDLLSASGKDAFLADELSPPSDGDVPVATAGALVYLKLKSPRQKDRADVVELVKAGLDVDAARAYLALHAAELESKLEACVAAARAEEEE
jgi:hypothetical protein